MSVEDSQDFCKLEPNDPGCVLDSELAEAATPVDDTTDQTGGSDDFVEDDPEGVNAEEDSSAVDLNDDVTEVQIGPVQRMA